MNVGFDQYSFGLQQVQCIIYDFLGASPDQIPLLNLFGPCDRIINSTTYWCVK
jgi:maltose/moltooligosaccharide transporter